MTSYTYFKLPRENKSRRLIFGH